MHAKSTTLQADKAENGSILQLVWMLLLFMEAAVQPHMWKRDVQNAFRRLPIHCAYLQFAWFVWMANQIIWCAQHRGMPFGAVSSVVAWHRVGALLKTIAVQLAKCPVARYVDDFSEYPNVP